MDLTKNRNVKVITKERFEEIRPYLAEFPKIHKEFKADLTVLFDYADQVKNDPSRFQALSRASLTYLFILIEADIYYYNLFDKYEGYKDSRPFMEKFENTFKQICGTWNWKKLQEEYFASQLEKLILLKKQRDKLTHPKRLDDIVKLEYQDLEAVKDFFHAYDKFIRTIMSNFFFQYEHIPETEGFFQSN